MTQSAKKDSPVIVLPPPRIAMNKLSDKYKLIVDVQWGPHTIQFTSSLEQPSPISALIKEINMALMELSEKEPYIVQ